MKTKRIGIWRFNLLFFTTMLMINAYLSSCGANIFTIEDDVAMGRELDEEIRNDNKTFPILQGNDEVKQYVSGIGLDIITKSDYVKYEKIFPYKFEVIDDDSTVNAFCIPGGFIYVYTGLIKYLDNESALAGVIGHEIAHAERRHMSQRLTSYYGVSFILSLVLGSNPNQLAEIFANLAVGIGFLANSRSDETDADNYSIQYLRSTEYFPGGIMYFFKNIRDEQKLRGETPGDIEELLSTHPLPTDRITNAETKLRSIKPKPDPEKGLFTERYQRIKSLLDK
ncbi:MAG: M48 family metalloprotease [Ignavibacteria bacterium]|jgi:predicted Zn-dependent protease|nr:M48 family metalloprotease [Ignavibacteria bacterium]MBK9228009.1 M48 family metalloprotease [Ignavibacteria bacterium]